MQEYGLVKQTSQSYLSSRQETFLPEVGDLGSESIAMHFLNNFDLDMYLPEVHGPSVIGIYSVQVVASPSILDELMILQLLLLHL